VRGHLRAAGLLVAAALMSTSLVACGGGAEADKEKDKEKIGAGAAADLSTCKDDAKAAATPYGDGFPADWPFPPATVVYNAEDRDPDGTIVSGVSSSSFKDILDFLNQDAVDAGFTMKKGETEDHDAEAEWQGNGFRGRWAIRESVTCPGETVIQVLSAAE
jgi:hypothetical protein